MFFIGAITTAALFVLSVTGIAPLSAFVILLPLLVGVVVDLVLSIF